MQKVAQGASYEDLIKHERDSADLTMSRIPISSHGTDPALSGAGLADGKDNEHHNASAIEIRKKMKRQMTMEQEQDKTSLDMPRKEDRDDRISMPGAKKRVNSGFIEVQQPRSTEGPMMVVGQGYSQKPNLDATAVNAAR